MIWCQIWPKFGILKNFWGAKFVLKSLKMNLQTSYIPFWNRISVSKSLISSNLGFFGFFLTQWWKMFVQFFMDQTLGQWFETQWFSHLSSWHFCPFMLKLGRTELFNHIYFEDSAYTNGSKYHHIVLCIEYDTDKNFRLHTLGFSVFGLST